MKRHVAKMMGYAPRYRPIRNHLFNATFAFSGVLVAFGGFLSAPWLMTVGWVVCVCTFVGGTTVPCGWNFVNNNRLIWYFRQLLFVSAGTAVLIYALRAL